MPASLDLIRKVLLGNHWASPAGFRGRREAFERAVRAASPGRLGPSMLEPALARWMDDLAGLVRPSTVPSVPYFVPWAGVVLERVENVEHLGVADVAWLDRLPADPAAVSDDDAKALFVMFSKTKANTSDHRLAAQRFEPVRAYHEALAAQRELDRIVEQEPPTWPASTLGVVAEAAAAAEGLDLDSAAVRASQLIVQWRATAVAEWERRYQFAADRLASVRAAA